jgi:CheY-like chemotaxis protein
MGLGRVLVVEDSKPWRNTLRQLLEREGYDVTVCEDAETALEELKIRYYPVVVVDMRLKGDEDAEGLEIVREIDRLWFGHGIQTIIISGYPLSPEQTQQVTRLTRGRNVSFVSKVGDKTKSFDSAQFVSLVSLAIARISQPASCLFSGLDCGQDIEPKLNQVFVAMPYSIKSPGITVNMDDVYKLGIQPALRDVGLDPVRADERPLVGALICNICAGIQESAICLADITDWNPNVLFELGLMAGMGKTTVILKHAKSDVPTDLKFALYVEYDSIRSVKARLKKVIKALLDSNNRGPKQPGKSPGLRRRDATN